MIKKKVVPNSDKAEQPKTNKDTEAILRLKKDILNFQQQKKTNDSKELTNVTLRFPDPQQINPIHIVIRPKSGLYKNSELTFIFTIPENYPYKSPIVECKQRVFHPNIDPQNRAVCLSILKDAWEPQLDLLLVVYGLTQILESLCERDIQKPLDARAAQLFKQDLVKYKQILDKTLKGQSFEGRQFDNVWVN